MESEPREVFTHILLISVKQQTKGRDGGNMADVIIITVLAVAVFFVIRRELKKLRKGQCCSGCAECKRNCLTKE